MSPTAQRHQTQRHLTPPAIAARLGVAAETVIGWIRSGELPAANVAKRGCRRPRYRIAPEDLEAFLATRRPDAPARAAKPSRRRKQESGVIQYY
ncbi:MAG: helix-turn-helix domain-containing protein [Gemmataceae bacterium]